MNLHRTSTSAFGLIAWLEQTQIHLPLKAIECRFDASAAAVDVQIDQVFHQSAGRPLDVTYSFPLPSKAAAYRCEMIANGRTIRAKVMEQEAAREIARQNPRGSRSQQDSRGATWTCAAFRRPRIPRLCVPQAAVSRSSCPSMWLSPIVISC